METQNRKMDRNNVFGYNLGTLDFERYEFIEKRIK